MRARRSIGGKAQKKHGHMSEPGTARSIIHCELKRSGLVWQKDMGWSNQDIAAGTETPLGLTRVFASVIFSDGATYQMSGTGDDMGQVSLSLLDILMLACSPHPPARPFT